MSALTITIYILLGWFGLVTLYVYYIAAMQLLFAWKELDWKERLLAAGPAIIKAAFIDLFVHVIVGTVIFFDLPRELTLTMRMRRYKRGRDGYRKRLATSICKRINRYDRKRVHC